MQNTIKTWTPNYSSSPVVKKFETANRDENLSDWESMVQNQDRISFQNGGSITELKDSSSQLLLKRPDGSSYKTQGWITEDPSTGEPFVEFSTKDESGRATHWQQSFPTSGGTVIRQEAAGPTEDLLITVEPNGSVSGNFEEEGPQVPAWSQGNSLIFQDWQEESVSPLVPLDWVISK